MDWASYIRDYRKRHGLRQAEFATLMGVQQATVSRWETGSLRPGIAAQRRLREKVAGFNAQADLAIIRSVRLTGTLARLVLVDKLRYIAFSEGVCRLNGTDHDTILRLSFFDIISERGRQIAADQAVLRGLLDGDLLAVQITDMVPKIAGGRPHLMSTTISPLWLSDGTALLREDSVLLPAATFDGSNVEYFARNDNLLTV